MTRFESKDIPAATLEALAASLMPSSSHETSRGSITPAPRRATNAANGRTGGRRATLKPLPYWFRPHRQQTLEVVGRIPERHAAVAFTVFVPALETLPGLPNISEPGSISPCPSEERYWKLQASTTEIEYWVCCSSNGRSCGPTCTSASATAQPVRASREDARHRPTRCFLFLSECPARSGSRPQFCQDGSFGCVL